ncbi:MAG: leucine-rich repeat protein [Clostridia bacterium]|nr:leucine-rich repeat protein [Clostridia bacterium]
MKKVIAFILCFSLITSFFTFLPTGVFAESYAGVCGDDLTWTFDPGEAKQLTISGTGDMYDYDDFYDVPWNELMSQIEYVYFSPGVTHIGNSAFLWANNLRDVFFPNTLESIGNYSFAKCIVLDKVGLPDSLNSLGTASFLMCANLTTIRIPEGITEIPDLAFSKCYDLQSVRLPETLRSIGVEAFMDCESLEEIYVPDGVTSIASGAFGFCDSVKKMYLPANLDTIYSFWFPTSIEEIYYKGSKTEWDGKLNTNNDSRDVLSGADIFFEWIDYPDSCGEFAEWSWDEETGTLSIYGSGDMYNYNIFASRTVPWMSIKPLIKSIKIEGTINKIGDSAFLACENVTKIDLPDSVTAIGNKAFYGCYSLSEINIPEGVVEIGKETFFCCIGLESITLPETIRKIGESAFYYCTSLKTIYLPLSLLTIDRIAFYDCSSLKDVYYNGSEGDWNEIDIYNHANGNGCLLNARIHFKIPTFTQGTCGDALTWEFNAVTGVLTISGEGAMENYGPQNRAGWYSFKDNIVKLVIENGVTYIGSYAFSECGALETIYLPESLSFVGNSAFSGCDSLTDVYYDGFEKQWKSVSIYAQGNDPLKNAAIHYTDRECTHSWNGGDVTVSPTCQIEGSVTYKCNICDGERTEVLPKTDHSYYSYYLVDAEPTYSSNGLKTKHCRWCDATCDPIVIPRLISDIAGDATGDGYVDMKDVLIMRKHILGIDRISDDYFANSDRNGDGFVNMKDVLAVRKLILNIN